jgi:nitroreductase
MLDRQRLEDLVAEARLAPSVHNIQPTRWRRDGEALLVLADETRTLPAADPKGHDVRLSHGAAIEGMSIALGRRGLRIARIETALDATLEKGIVARIALATGSEADPLAAAVARRASWRGAFQRSDPELPQRLAHLADARDDLIVISEKDAVAKVATLADRAAFHFLCDNAHRGELLQWMRLSRSDPRYGCDGLDAEALALGRTEAFAASLVLGPLFPALRRLGLASLLTSERGKTASGAIALFHRPLGEDPLETGRAFYRAWLAIECAGLAACPISVLADWPLSNSALVERFAVPRDRRLVNVFRVGAATRPGPTRRARLAVEDLIV